MTNTISFNQAPDERGLSHAQIFDPDEFFRCKRWTQPPPLHFVRGVHVSTPPTSFCHVLRQARRLKMRLWPGPCKADLAEFEDATGARVNSNSTANRTVICPRLINRCTDF